MDELKKLFISYSKEHQNMSVDGIGIIIAFLAAEYGLNDYIDSYKIVDYVGDGAERIHKITKYDPENKQILISREALKRAIKYEKIDFNHITFASEDENYFITNTVIIESIIHEIEKISQIKLMKKNNIEANILRYATVNSAYTNNNPAERVATINSWKKINELVKDIKQYPRVIQYCNRKLDEAEKEGYYDINNNFIEEGPTYNFCYEIEKPKIQKVNFIKSLEQMKKKFVGTDVKILYGLPVTENRFNRHRGYRV